MNEWAKVVSEETVPMRHTPWGGQVHWLTYPAATGNPYLTSGILKIFPGQGHEPHVHADSEEILFIMEGTGIHRYILEDGTEKVFQVKPGDVLWVNRGQLHSTENRSDQVLKVFVVYTCREIEPAD